ncbi:SH3 domain-containing protein [Roseovarius sp. SCSIO 43702]|uniref:SH3 domain-containing protein n=1 Tax=Roseovarius sp. SCSIO 43702 TaxID=2823043 RepID=UPI001C73B863|nr:SH3 domain-containing protein [Roseovarius sp. SCSIO 43702]QYX56086.1 SH3 domain-containing protein [Roseovarius sp. SCSIO 43702]
MWRFIVVSFGFLGFAFYELSGGADYRPHEDSLQAHMQRERDRAATLTRVAEADAATPARRTDKGDKGDEKADDFDVATTRTMTRDTDEVDAAAIDAALTAALEKEKGAGITATTEATVIPAAATREADTPAAGVTTSVIGLSEVTQQADDGAQVTLASSGNANGFGALGAALRIDMTGASGAGDEGSSASGVTQVAVADSAAADIRRVTGNLVNMRAGPGTSYGRVDQLAEGARVRVLEDLGNGWLHLEVEETGQVGYMADWLVTASN